MKYAVVIEKGQGCYGAYAPDLPGCGVAGTSRSAVMDMIPEAISMHLAGLREQGLEIPEPSAIEFVDVAA